MKNIIFLVVLHSVTGCLHSRGKAHTGSQHSLGPGGVEVIHFRADCGHSNVAKTTPKEDEFAIAAATKLLGQLRSARIPNTSAREAVESGLPIVESILGPSLNPILGPDLNSKPFAAFVRLTLIPDGGIVNCLDRGSGTSIEFVPIGVGWTVVGQPPNRTRQDEGQETFWYGVSLNKPRGRIFYTGSDLSIVD